MSIIDEPRRMIVLPDGSCRRVPLTLSQGRAPVPAVPPVALLPPELVAPPLPVPPAWPRPPEPVDPPDPPRPPVETPPEPLPPVLPELPPLALPPLPPPEPPAPEPLAPQAPAAARERVTVNNSRACFTSSPGRTPNMFTFRSVSPPKRFIPGHPSPQRE